jgi:MoaA/NifB/PqqE/SkfB family radical SAM enzyme
MLPKCSLLSVIRAHGWVMAEPNLQVEVQLGHLCNNRCVFCVSGQLSEQKNAPQLPPEPIRKQILQARSDGATKMTFLGGEPTMQRSFFDFLALAVDLNFNEIVIFTNGTMTPRESFRQRTLAILEGLGPDMRKRVIWRFSLQGGTKAEHDATTMNPGAWDRIVKSMEAIKDTGARMTGNMCVVESNWRSIVSLADMAQKYRFENLHLDMIRPRDSGDRTDAQLQAMMARYSDMAPKFAELVAACDEKLGPDFDLNFGNVPYCTAPMVSHRIHHDGEMTVTIAADGDGGTQPAYNKYQDKREDKHKPPLCGACVFNGVCSGVFDKYRQFYGDSEFRPISVDELWARDTGGHHFMLLARKAIEDVAKSGGWRITRTNDSTVEFEVAVPVDPEQPEGPQWRVSLRRPGRRGARAGWYAVASDRLEASIFGPNPQTPASISRVNAALQELATALGTNLPAMTAADVDKAWRKHEQEVAAKRQRDTQTWRQLAGLVDRLRAEPIANLRPGPVRKHADQLAVELDFAGAGGRITLTVHAGENAEGRFVPRFQHVVEGLDETAVGQFSMALGRRLRGASAAPDAVGRPAA